MISSSPLLPLLLLLIVRTPSVSAVDSLVVSLHGAPHTADYMQQDSGLSYQLRCRYRAGYDDKVDSVTWLLQGEEVYSYSFSSNRTTVSPLLRSLVDTTPSENPQDIHLLRAELKLSGRYSCLVSSSKGSSESDSLSIRVIHVASDAFSSSVSILGSQEESSNSSSDSVEASSSRPSLPSPPPPSPDCQVVWSFSTPAITPRPNVTCGVYSYSQDDISQQLPGGLQMHQLPNNSWQAVIQRVKVPVVQIPYQGRLGCRVSVPHTSYRKVVTFEDGLSVDHLIDSRGCPSLQGLTDYSAILQEVSGASPSCRGDWTPLSKTQPATALLRCPQAARHRDGSISLHWNMRLSCDSADLQWRQQREEEGERETVSVEDFPWPLCVESHTSGQERPTHSPLWLPLLLLLPMVTST